MENLRAETLKQIKSAVDAHGKVYVHGDGNIYHDKSISDGTIDRTKEAGYRVTITKSNIPGTLDELITALKASKGEIHSAQKSAKKKSTKKPK